MKTSQTHHGIRSISVAAILLAVAGLPVDVSGAIINWNFVGGGNFSDPTKWNPAVVPGPADDAVFNLVGNRSVTMDVALVGSLAFRAGNVSFIDGGNVATNVEVGQFAGDSAFWSNRSITTLGGRLTLGRDLGSSGTVTLDAAFLAPSRVELTSPTGDVLVGSAGVGVFNVNGSLVLQDDVLVGFNAGGAGTLAVSATTEIHPFLGELFIQGRVTGTGPNSDLIVGNSGTGTLNVTNGGSVQMAGAVSLGRNASGSGTALVTGINLANVPTPSQLVASRLDIAANAFSGPSGGTGSLTVANNARVVINGPTTVGDPDGGGVATLRLQSNGSLETHDFIDRGNVTSLEGGALIVQGNYLASAGTAFWVKGQGTVLLDGPLARLNAAAASNSTALRVGESLSIELQVEDGGIISVSSGNVAINVANSTAQLVIDPGGTLTCVEDVIVGESGTGLLALAGTASTPQDLPVATVRDCRLGVSAGGVGRINVDEGILTAQRVVVGEHASAGPCSIRVNSGGHLAVNQMTDLPNSTIQVFDDGVIESASNLTVRGTMLMLGGRITCPTLTLANQASHELSGILQGSLNVGSLFVEPVISNLLIETNRTPSVSNSGSLNLRGVFEVRGPSTWFLNNATLGPAARVQSQQRAQISAGRTVVSEGVFAAPIRNLGQIRCSGVTCRVESQIDNTSGVINGTLMTLAPTGSLIAGSSVVCKIVSEPGSSIVAVSDATLGDAASDVGVDLRGSLNCGQFPVSLNTTVETFVADTQLAGGHISCRNGAGTPRRIRLRGEFTGFGTVTAQTLANVDASGESVVDPQGLLTIQGGYLQLGSVSDSTISGTLRGQINSTTDFDRLVVSSTARLGGTLSYRPAAGFVVDRQLSLTILTAGERSGQFENLDLPPGWSVEYTSTSVILNIACPADVNGDLGVDGDDVIFFFENWDRGLLAADFNGDEGVDGDDVIAFFNRWDQGC